MGAPPRSGGARLRLALAQINPTVGDLAGNAAKVEASASRALELGAALVLFPEMVLAGYPPEDLLLNPLFLKECELRLRRLAARLPPDLVTVLGAPERGKDSLYNGAAVIFKGRIAARYRKWFLPNYGVFDEKRYFAAGDQPLVFDVNGARVGLSVCEDVWRTGGPAPAAAGRGASLILNLSASPYHAGKIRDRLEVLRDRIKESGAAHAYVNMVGGQDELVYDGGSLVLDGSGRVLAQAPQFAEHLLLADLDLPRVPAKAPRAPSFTLPDRARTPAAPLKAPRLGREEEIYSALTLGTRDYMAKNGFAKAVIGLSGGIDSSLVACVAVDAVGPENVIGVTMPSRFNSPETRADAENLARALGMAFHAIPIEATVQSFLDALAPLFAGRERDVTEENLQARVRGTLLMALSNKFGWLVLTTGNKSEVSAGYFTLYGDSAGGFAVIKDIPKTLVYDLARWRNGRAGSPLIAASVLSRAPSAELRDNQRDQDSLPPYPVLDRIIQAYVEENRGLEEILRSGVGRAAARRMLTAIDAAEYKRRQAPPGIKITPRAFGRDRRMPITNRFRPYAGD